MARTKMSKTGQIVKPPPRPRYEAGTATVISAHPRSIDLFVYSNVRDGDGGTTRKKEGGGPRSKFEVVEGTNAIPLWSYEKKEDVVSWSLVMYVTYGVFWRNGGEDSDYPRRHETDYGGMWEMKVQPAHTYHLDSDPRNPLLTDAQFATVHEIIMRQMQKAAPDVELWSLVEEELRKPEHRFGPIPEDLGSAFPAAYPRRSMEMPRWLDDYPKFALKADSSEQWAQKDLDRGLAPGGRARVDVYWRALDRLPGVNTDVHVVCYTFDCETLTVSMRTFENTDDGGHGGGCARRREYEPDRLSEKIQSKDVAFVDFLTALRQLGTGDSECTILDDTSPDWTAYDSTWTSHEIVAFHPRPWSPSVNTQFPAEHRRRVVQFLLVNKVRMQLPFDVAQKILEFAAPSVYVPVTRLHQRCVYGSQWREYDNLDEKYKTEIPATSSQREVLAAARDLVGMGRVNTWAKLGSDEPSCEARTDEPCDSVVMEDQNPDEGGAMFCTLFPYYFDFPARNVSNGERGSADWVERKKQEKAERDEAES